MLIFPSSNNQRLEKCLQYAIFDQQLLLIGSMPAWDQGQVCQAAQDGRQSLKWPGIRNQYPQDIVKPAGLKNDVNSRRPI